MPDLNDLKVAVIGCGRMGQIRAKASAECGATVVSVFDANHETAQELATQLAGCDALQSVDELDWSELDAVFVCTPPFARGDIEIRAIQHGVAILVEKPLGLSTEQVEPIMQALKLQPVINAVGYMNRYRESVLRAHRALLNTPVLGASGNWLCGTYGVSWWGQKGLSGGSVNEQATHLVDLARFLVGEIVEVQAVASPANGNGELIETAAFNMRFANGSLYSMHYSCMARAKMIGIQIFTPEFRVLLDGWDFQLKEDGTDVAPPPPDADRNDVFRKEVRAFLEAVSSNCSDGILCDLQDALQTQSVVDALNRSIQTGLVETVIDLKASTDNEGTELPDKQVA